MSYQTKQGKALTDYLKTIGSRHVSVAEIAENMPEHIGTATIYRQLERMEKDGSVQRFVQDGGAACYCYVGAGAADCHMHFHLKCATCGALIHLECEEMDRLSEHILTEHGFRTDPLRTSLYGTCADCLRKEREGQ